MVLSLFIIYLHIIFLSIAHNHSREMSFQFTNPKPTKVKISSTSSEDCQKIGCSHARFGISLSKLGDINMDGFQGMFII